MWTKSQGTDYTESFTSKGSVVIFQKSKIPLQQNYFVKFESVSDPTIFQEITIQVQSDHLIPVIDGGNREITKLQTLILDGSRSLNPNTGNSSGFIYQWSCQNVINFEKCNSQSQAQFVMQPYDLMSSTEMQAKKFPKTIYVTLKLTDLNTKLTGQKTVKVMIVDIEEVIDFSIFAPVSFDYK